ncbi:hypothetical protein C8R44DRAFT_730329 [Mycena epipterygia]|nr:hypothetical protein C8R44DRAFT_730329 [Mycena epipterygia]
MFAIVLMQQNQNAAIPELEESEVAPDFYEGGYEYECEYTLDLGSGLAECACPTPWQSYFKRPLTSNLGRPPRREKEKEAERDGGICGSWAPPRTGGVSPAARLGSAVGVNAVEKKGLLALGSPALLLMVPRTPSHSVSPAPSFSSSSDSDSDSAISCSSYSSSYASYSISPSSSESEEEDATDYSLPALLRVRGTPSIPSPVFGRTSRNCARALLLGAGGGGNCTLQTRGGFPAAREHQLLYQDFYSPFHLSTLTIFLRFFDVPDLYAILIIITIWFQCHIIIRIAYQHQEHQGHGTVD